MRNCFVQQSMIEIQQKSYTRSMGRKESFLDFSFHSLIVEVSVMIINSSFPLLHDDDVDVGTLAFNCFNNLFIYFFFILEISMNERKNSWVKSPSLTFTSWVPVHQVISVQLNSIRFLIRFYCWLLISFYVAFEKRALNAFLCVRRRNGRHRDVEVSCFEWMRKDRKRALWGKRAVRPDILPSTSVWSEFQLTIIIINEKGK